MRTADLFADRASGATFSHCGRYRYRLWRLWNPDKPAALFILLNPSTADETRNDPTVERCQRRAISLGYGGVRIANIFALRSTDPRALYESSDPIGPDNDTAILDAARDAGIIVCGWGVHGALFGRGNAVRDRIRRAGLKAFFLGINQDGSPKHPLYVAYNSEPTPWEDLTGAIGCDQPANNQDAALDGAD